MACLPRALGGLVTALALGASDPTMAADPSRATFALHCEMRVHALASSQLRLQFVLRNEGPQAIHLLRWGTPFEGAWMAPFVRVENRSGELPYLGARVKHGEPEADDYLLLPPGKSLQADLPLDDAFDRSALSQTPLTLRAQWRWHDAMPASLGSPPRPRAAHQGLDQDCGSVTWPR